MKKLIPLDLNLQDCENLENALSQERLPDILKIGDSLILTDTLIKDLKTKEIINFPSQADSLKVIPQKAYLLYKQDWKDQHGISKELEQKVFADYCNYIKEEDLSSNDYSFEDYLFEFGFNNGEMYASYEEFLRNEFRNKTYINALLSKYSK